MSWGVLTRIEIEVCMNVCKCKDEQTFWTKFKRTGLYTCDYYPGMIVMNIIWLLHDYVVRNMYYYTHAMQSAEGLT